MAANEKKPRKKKEKSQKCDGNHAWPRCADPNCWNDSPTPHHKHWDRRQ